MRQSISQSTEAALNVKWTTPGIEVRPQARGARETASGVPRFVTLSKDYEGAVRRAGTLDTRLGAAQRARDPLRAEKIERQLRDAELEVERTRSALAEYVEESLRGRRRRRKEFSWRVKTSDPGHHSTPTAEAKGPAKTCARGTGPQTALRSSA